MYRNKDLFGLREWEREVVENLKIKVKRDISTMSILRIANEVKRRKPCPLKLGVPARGQALLTALHPSEKSPAVVRLSFGNYNILEDTSLGKSMNGMCWLPDLAAEARCSRRCSWAPVTAFTVS